MKKPNNIGMWLTAIVFGALILLLVMLSKGLSDSKQKIQNLALVNAQITRNQQAIADKLQYIIDHPPHNGHDGRDGANGLSVKGDKGDSVTGNNGRAGHDGHDGKDANPAKPCTTGQLEGGDVVIACPDGTASVIPKPLDGKNAPVQQCRFNLLTGNYECKFPTDLFWKVQIPKCAFAGGCLP